MRSGAMFSRSRSSAWTTGWPNLEDRAAKKWQMWCLVAPGRVLHDIRDDKSAATFVDLVGTFSGTAVTDQAATILYSLLETAKASGVDPARYLADAVRAARRGLVLLQGDPAGEPRT